MKLSERCPMRAGDRICKRKSGHPIPCAFVPAAKRRQAASSARARRPVTPHFTLSEAGLLEWILDQHAQAQEENAAVGMVGQRDATTARRALRELRRARQKVAP